jgi:hypothetical protein
LGEQQRIDFHPTFFAIDQAALKEQGKHESQNPPSMHVHALGPHPR